MYSETLCIILDTDCIKCDEIELTLDEGTKKNVLVILKIKDECLEIFYFSYQHI